MVMLVERQQELSKVIEKLEKLDFVESVCSDDFDSQWINVFINLKVKEFHYSYTRRRILPLKFTHHMRSIKSQILKVCQCRLLDWPEIDYYYDSIDRKQINDGYDISNFKIEVRV